MSDQKKVFSMAEVAKHNTEKDCWIALHDLVLNVDEEFLNEHPGGPDVVTALAGKDATRDFEDISHSMAAREWSNKLIIGCLEGASEELQADMKMPSKDTAAGGEGGGLGMMLPALVVVILAAAAYFFFQKPA